MLDLIQFTNDVDLARRCDALDGMRLCVDLERLGKAERQAGRNTFISTHQPEDVARIRKVLRRCRLMVRVNPLHLGTAAEVERSLADGADLLMLPMFGSARELAEFSDIVAARAPIVALLETASALFSVEEWASIPGVQEIFVGLNDLHLSLGQRFMFEALADGSLERVAQVARGQGCRFGFGGLARLDGGLLPGRAVLAEHVRLGSQAVILARSFHAPEAQDSFEEAVAQLRAAEAELTLRGSTEVHNDAQRTAAAIRRIAADLGATT